MSILVKKFKYLKNFLSLLICSLIISSCYSTQYQIIPPDTIEGARCANDCLSEKERCINNCEMINTQRNLMNHLVSQNRYLIEQKYNNVRDSSLYNYNSYSNNAVNDSCIRRCTENYYLCHKNCGGHIIVTDQNGSREI